MNHGASVQYFDVTTMLVFVFFFFFLGLVYYLRKEDKREGYPMVSDVTGERELGFPAPPPSKTYLRMDGQTATLPNDHERDPYLVARRTAGFPGAPLEPLNPVPLADGIGPGSYVEAEEKPYLNADGALSVVPLRRAAGWRILGQDPDPRGMMVVGADDAAAGTVVDLWIDTGCRLLRYLEVELSGAGGRVLTPLAFTTVHPGERVVATRAIFSHQFAGVPRLALPDQVTAREEDRISAYYAAGYLYATPARAEALL